MLKTEPDHVLPYLTTEFGAIMAFMRTYVTLQIRRGQELGHIRQGDAEIQAEILLRLLQSFTLTPQGVIQPGNEKNVRNFAEGYLKDFLAP